MDVVKVKKIAQMSDRRAQAASCTADSVIGRRGADFIADSLSMKARAKHMG